MGTLGKRVRSIGHRRHQQSEKEKNQGDLRRRLQGIRETQVQQEIQWEKGKMREKRATDCLMRPGSESTRSYARRAVVTTDGAMVLEKR